MIVFCHYDIKNLLKQVSIDPLDHRPTTSGSKGFCLRVLERRLTHNLDLCLRPKQRRGAGILPEAVQYRLQLS